MKVKHIAKRHGYNISDEEVDWIIKACCDEEQCNEICIEKRIKQCKQLRQPTEKEREEERTPQNLQPKLRL